MNNNTPSLKYLIFDWGDTLMHDFREKDGPMCYWDKVAVVDGVKDFLAYCYEKYPLMVASNSGFSTTEMMVKALNRGGIDRYFSHFFTSKDIGVEKPNPLFFDHILKHTKAIASTIGFIGNDYLKDVEAAKNSGMTTFFYNPNHLNGDFPAADYTFRHFDELYQIV